MTNVDSPPGSAQGHPLDAAHLTSPPPEAFVEIPGLRGLRVALVAKGGGNTIEVVDAVKGVIVPARHNPGREQGKVLRGSLRFMQDGKATVLAQGDGWDIPAGAAQGPHVVLEDNTRVVILREGDAGLA